MDAQELEQLLWQGESPTLDFKRQQYRFDHATDEDRSELLKDILAFATRATGNVAHDFLQTPGVRRLLTSSLVWRKYRVVAPTSLVFRTIFSIELCKRLSGPG